MRIIILVFFTLFFAIACKRNYYDTRLHITNNSDSSVYVVIGDRYKDTTYVFINYHPRNDPEKYKIKPYETKIAIKPIGSWEKVFENTDTVSLYFFDSYIMETISWETIKSNFLVLARYDYTLNDFINLDWVIKYPVDSTTAFPVSE